MSITTERPATVSSDVFAAIHGRECRTVRQHQVRLHRDCLACHAYTVHRDGVVPALSVEVGDDVCDWVTGEPLATVTGVLVRQDLGYVRLTMAGGSTEDFSPRQMVRVQR